MPTPRLGVFGLTGCAGDQLVLLNCEDELLDLAALLDVRDFLMASSANDVQGELDVALVEGAVAGRRDEERLRRIRDRAGILVALGSCAVWGGVAAIETHAGRAARLAEVYGPLGQSYDSAPARALHEVVKVDLCLPGCPVEKQELLALIAHLLNGNPPPPVGWPVCTECRMAESNCLLNNGKLVCSGPLTVGGCGARCPQLGVPCIGCRGPVEDANLAGALAMFEQKGLPREAVLSKLRTFSGRAPLGGPA